GAPVEGARAEIWPVQFRSVLVAGSDEESNRDVARILESGGAEWPYGAPSGLTGADGRVRLPGLPGTWLLRVFLEADADDAILELPVDLPTSELALQLPVQPASFAGRVVAEDGRGISGASVRLIWRDDGQIHTLSARSGSRGQFVFERLLPRTTWQLQAWRSDYVGGVFEVTPADGDGAREFVLRPAAHLSVLLQNLDGNALDNARVRIVGPQSSVDLGMLPSEHSFLLMASTSGRTNRGGFWRATGLAPGSYTLEFVIPTASEPDANGVVRSIDKVWATWTLVTAPDPHQLKVDLTGWVPPPQSGRRR
ncbi:MAG TPA: carboxypeptidase-like regulatory domain-containing protein, partial [Planctomycetota bacterium]